jgi:hypothetical protein
MTDDLTKLRAELLAGLDGVTPGPWEVAEEFRIVFDNDEARGVIAECWTYDSPYEDLHAKAAHIARCSPENIRALLEALDDAEREASALAASQCLCVTGDDYGNAYCRVAKERDEARAALAPFAALPLYPEDDPEDTDPPEANDDAQEDDLLIERGWIRSAREALKDRTP